MFNDAAAELPPADNLTTLVKQGFDLSASAEAKRFEVLEPPVSS